jgi:hypothetical protein
MPCDSVAWKLKDLAQTQNKDLQKEKKLVKKVEKDE